MEFILLKFSSKVQKDELPQCHGSGKNSSKDLVHCILRVLLPFFHTFLHNLINPEFCAIPAFKFCLGTFNKYFIPQTQMVPVCQVLGGPSVSKADFCCGAYVTVFSKHFSKCCITDVYIAFEIVTD